jgi:type IV pilus assembly protein PilV
MNTPPSESPKQRGFTLIEVLVSMMLMTLTMVGLAGLLGIATRIQLGVESRSTAAQIMNDLGNRIRANLVTTNTADLSTWANHYTDIAVSSESWSAQQSTTTTPATNCLTTSCTPAQMAAFDLAETRGQMARAMPQPALLISGDAAAGLRITFAWFDKDFTQVTDGVVELQTSPTCGSGTGAAALSCCPVAVGVGSTPGVRCLNMDLRP